MLSVSVVKNSYGKYIIGITFIITLHAKDIDIFRHIKYYFNGCGSNVSIIRGYATYSISGIADIIKYVIPHFNNYPLCTQKGADYLLWSQIASLMATKEHLHPKGFETCLSLAASINEGLNSNIAMLYPNIISVERSVITAKQIDGYWLSVFTAGDESFNVSIASRPAIKLGSLFLPSYDLKQHSKDLYLMQEIQKFFNGAGHIKISR